MSESNGSSSNGKKPAQEATEATTRAHEEFEKGDWAIRYLEAFDRLKAVGAACDIAGINRSTVKRRRDRDPLFEELETEIGDAITEALEQEAHRRAVDGVQKVRLYKGEPVTDAEGNQLVETEYSDRLLELLLRARAPEKYTQRLDVRDTREEARKRELERMPDEEVKRELVGLDDNVVDLEDHRERKAG